MKVVYAQQGDTLDSLAYRTFGSQSGIVEQVLELNPHLANMTILPLGQVVKLPELNLRSATTTKQTVQLWS